MADDDYKAVTAMGKGPPAKPSPYDDAEVVLPNAIEDGSITFNGQPTRFDYDQDKPLGSMASLQQVGQVRPQSQGAKLSGPSPKYSSATAPSPTAPPAPRQAPRPQAQRQRTPEELRAEAAQMLASMKEQHAAMLTAPSATQAGLDRTGEAPPAGWLAEYMNSQRGEGRG